MVQGTGLNKGTFVPSEHMGIKNSSVWKLLAVYTAVFAVLSICVYYSFIAGDKTLIRYYADNKDAFSQRYIFIFEFQRFLSNLFEGGSLNTWDWSIGLGADAFSFNLTGLVNPINYITLFNPEKYADVTYSIGIIIKLYLSGAMFILLAAKLGLNNVQIMIGALMYAFSAWNLDASVTQGTFVIASVLLPLVILGMEKVLRGESPLVFILSVAYTILASFTFAYMIAIVTIIYFFVRFFTCEWTEKDPKSFFRTMFTTMAYGITGILLSGFGLVVILTRYGRSTSSSGTHIPTFFEVTDYLRMPLRLLDMNSLFGGNSVIGLTALQFIFIPVIVYCCCRKRTNALMTVLLMVFVLIPYMYSVLNFFSYVSGRWMFAIPLFFSLAVAESLDMRYLENRKIRISMAAMTILYIPYLLWLQKILNRSHKLILSANMLTVILLLIVICVGARLYASSADAGKKNSRSHMLITALVIITTLGMTTASAIDMESVSDKFLVRGEAAGIISSSPQRVISEIEDEDFYRIDQMGDLTGNWAPHCKVNESIYYGNRSNSVFYSSVDVDWLRYNKLLGNNMGYYKRVAPNSNDNRFGLDLLTGVKYYIGNDENGIENASDYAGHSFLPYSDTQGIQLLRNRKSIGLGCVFSKYMREEEWMKLSYPEREIAMLEAVVIPKDQDAPADMEELHAKDVKGIVGEIPYEIDSTADTVFLRGKNDGEHQVILSIENLRNSENWRNFITVDYGSLTKYAINTIGDNRGFSDIKDITLNLGYKNNAADEISINYRLTGHDQENVTYEWDAIKLYSVPLNEYDKRADELMANSMKQVSLTGDRYKGTVECSRNGILYLSILDDAGWDIRIDGKAAKPVHKLDIAFMGVEIEKGRHTVELEYHTVGLKWGIVVSILGCVITVLIMLHRKRVNSKV